VGAPVVVDQGDVLEGARARGRRGALRVFDIGACKCAEREREKAQRGRICESLVSF
jgi:hypothetical protein